jgi:general secretion pathway protein F
MTHFHYQAVELSGHAVTGVIAAADRKTALQLLGEKGLFPSHLEVQSAAAATNQETVSAPATATRFRLGPRIKRKEITALTRELATLLRATIPIPQALDSLSEEEENPALKKLIHEIAESVRLGASLSGALSEHPRLFSKLYVSMVRVGEEAGALDKVLLDLAALLEHEDEVRGEVASAVAYPCFVLGFGIFTVIVLLTFVLPRLFDMLQEMLDTLPLPTRVLLGTSEIIQGWWWLIILATGGAAYGLIRYFKTPEGARRKDQIKLKLPVMGGVFYSSALSRFARTLGTLLKAGVSLAGPLRKLGVFPRTVTQMINVGEETGRLDDMLLQVAQIEERRMRAQTKTLISLLAPALILVVGALVGFMVIALLLPIFKMSQAIR